MDQPLALPADTERDDERIRTAVAAETPRLRAFIRRRVEDLADVDDLIQDTLAELVESYRFVRPVEQVAGWLFRVARNRITDRYRARARESRVRGPWPASPEDDDDAPRLLEDWFAADAAGPEAAYLRATLARERLQSIYDDLDNAEVTT